MRLKPCSHNTCFLMSHSCQCALIAFTLQRMKRVVSRDIASTQRQSGALQSCRDYSDLLNRNIKFYVLPFSLLELQCLSRQCITNARKFIIGRKRKVLGFFLQ